MRFSRLAKNAIAVLLASLTTAAFAKEGFSASIANAPPAVLAAWEATFAIVTDSGTKFKIGTAFLVWKTKSESSASFYFLTVNHVVDSSCEIGKICPSTALIKNLRMRYQADGKAYVEASSRSEFNQVTVVQRSSNPDLALLRVTVQPSSTETPKPIPLPSNCNLTTGEPLFSIGFPATIDRTNSSQLPIDEKDVQTKRWSEGLFVDLFNEKVGSETKLYIGTTTDTLEGSSGGPIVNASGEVISLNVKSSSLPANQFQYLGSEDKGRLDWQTLGVRCETLRDLKSKLPP